MARIGLFWWMKLVQVSKYFDAKRFKLKWVVIRTKVRKITGKIYYSWLILASLPKWNSRFFLKKKHSNYNIIQINCRKYIISKTSVHAFHVMLVFIFFGTQFNETNEEFSRKLNYSVKSEILVLLTFYRKCWFLSRNCRWFQSSKTKTRGFSWEEKRE